MAQLNTYLNFSGNTEEAFNFYKSVFGGEFSVIQRFSETPFAAQMPEADRNKIMHISLPVGHGVLMGTDTLESAGHSLTLGNNFSISVNASTEAEADQFFNGLAEGGTVTMPLENTFWGAYFGMLRDKFGIQWMVNYEHEKNK